MRSGIFANKGINADFSESSGTMPRRTSGMRVSSGRVKGGAERPAGLRMIWARMLKRVFDIGIEKCACGGKLKFVASIEQSEVIEKILTHLGLSPQPPPIAPARREDLFAAA